MLNESVKPAKILTEEDIRHFGKIAANSTLSYAAASALITSHRAINERNRLLVQENDELMAENVKLKQALNDVWEVDSSDWELAVRTQYSIIAKALEELK